MTASASSAEVATSSFTMRLAYWLAFAFVVVGLFNAMPGIPGLDALVADLTGQTAIRIRRFPYEYFYPAAFFVMMLIVALRQVNTRKREGQRKPLALALDIALVAMAAAVSLAYLNEIQSVCLADQITGDRARLIEEALRIEKENAALFGMPEPSTVDDPQCLNTLGGWLVPIIGIAISVFLAYAVKVWGLPLVIVAIVVVGWTFTTIGVWYFFGADGLNKYLVTKLGGEPRTLADGYSRVHDILTSNASGLLGRFMAIVLNEIFPYLILGALFGVSAGGQSLIKLAFRWTRSLRGGPAHAAVVSSAMFGTISGGPVVNVLSTGVLTIPMMLKRGFSRTFAGGIEAAASSGGAVMPPVMGVAAFILASMTAVPYRDVIVAALIPAIAYFFCLFLTVVFQARRQNIQAVGEFTDEMHMSRQDILNLVMIFAPIVLITALLLTPKETVGCGLLGTLLGAERTVTGAGCIARDLPWVLQLLQNAAGDVGGAGWWAVLLLMGLLFLDPAMRAAPRKLIDALSDAGGLIATLYLMFLVVTIIDFSLKMTGMPFYISLDVLQWLNSLNLGEGGAGFFQFLALAVTMLLAILLGMGMPAAPAFINVSLLMGPVLAGLGVSLFTANMFIFYFAAASAITPPVALAAYAAASITKADPIMTGLSAVRSGIVMFVIPFIFAAYPELLLIPQAVLDPQASGIVYLPGYDGTVDVVNLVLLILRLTIALYLLASALTAFDFARLGAWQVALRLALAVGIILHDPVVHGIATAAGLAVLVAHYLGVRAGARRLDLTT
ncbi:TRAP transporter permease [Frigidibacter oleivorans]|uniref:TRAP transporter permease n=1 Tax=Frigidibacter oleivorans TaxID=2487129 RepID=UPI001F1DA1FD|nr:TRAP transporter fused permease subunit [Frigidibacter oleivorans]